MSDPRQFSVGDRIRTTSGHPLPEAEGVIAEVLPWDDDFEDYEVLFDTLPVTPHRGGTYLMYRFELEGI